MGNIIGTRNSSNNTYLHVNHSQENNDSQISMLVTATTLCSKYDDWSINEKIMNVLNVNTNNLCIELKQKYPNADDKVVQSIVLALLLHFYMFWSGVSTDLNINKVD